MMLYKPLTSLGTCQLQWVYHTQEFVQGALQNFVGDIHLKHSFWWQGWSPVLGGGSFFTSNFDLVYPTNDLKKVSIQTLPRVWPIFLSIQIQFNYSVWEAEIQILASGQEWPKVHRLMWGFLIVLKPWAHYPFILPSRVAHRLDKAFCLNFWEIGCLCMILVT